MESIDVLGKLLAQENITIVRGKFRTASFDLKDRILRLPILVNMEPVEEALFMFHEVAHALFTSTDDYAALVKRGKEFGCTNFASYMNIIEDARIERMMREKFPGTRREFFAAYKSLHLNRDFFGVRAVDLDSLPLIDRINLHFKLGIMSRISFSTVEFDLLRKIESAFTLQDVFNCAKEAYELGRKEQAKIRDEHDMLEDDEKEEEDMFDSGDDTSDSDDEDDTSDSDDEDDMFDDVGSGRDSDEEEIDSGEIESGSSDDSSEGGEEDSNEKNDLPQNSDSDDDDVQAPMSKTQETFDENIDSAVDQENTQVYQAAYDTQPVYLPYADVLKVLQNYHSNSGMYLRNKQIVSYMLKEFEMRRAATRYSRQETHKTGVIDSKRLHAYRTAKEIFRTHSVVFDDENHSMLMLLDWSSSIRSVFNDNLEQVIALSMFCRAARIDFQVFAFCDADFRRILPLSDPLPVVQPKTVAGVKTFDSRSHYLIELFSSKMSNQQFQVMVDKVERLPDAIRLNATPLIDSLIDIRNYLPVFKRMFPAEKYHLIVVTDGTSNVSNLGISKNFIFSEKTNRRYLWKNDTNNISSNSSQISAINRLIRDENPDVRMTMFFVGRTSDIKNAASYMLCTEDRAKISRDGFVEVRSPSFDRTFFMRVSKIRDEDIGQALEGKKVTRAAASRALGNAINGSKSQRMMMSKFIDFIS